MAERDYRARNMIDPAVRRVETSRIPTPKAPDQGAAIRNIARQLADKAMRGEVFADELRELIHRRQLEASGHDDHA